MSHVSDCAYEQNIIWHINTCNMDQHLYAVMQWVQQNSHIFYWYQKLNVW